MITCNFIQFELKTSLRNHNTQNNNFHLGAERILHFISNCQAKTNSKYAPTNLKFLQVQKLQFSFWRVKNNEKFAKKDFDDKATVTCFTYVPF